MGKTRVIELKLDNKYVDKVISYDRNKLKPSKGDEVQFEPICVFKRDAEKSFWSWLPFERKKKSLILYVEGAYNALRFGKVTEKLQPLWTKKESERFADTQIKKSLEKHKPMTWGQFIIILIPNIVSLGILIMIAQRMGFF